MFCFDELVVVSSHNIIIVVSILVSFALVAIVWLLMLWYSAIVVVFMWFFYLFKRSFSASDYWWDTHSEGYFHVISAFSCHIYCTCIFYIVVVSIMMMSFVLIVSMFICYYCFQVFLMLLSGILLLSFSGDKSCYFCLLMSCCENLVLFPFMSFFIVSWSFYLYSTNYLRKKNMIFLLNL